MTGLRPEGCGRLMAAGCVSLRSGGRKKVLKMDRPSAGGFLGLTAFQAEGCGGGFAADYKRGRGWRRRLCRRVVSPQGKRLTMICASLALLQIMFAVHPRESVSHDSQVALLPYESCSLATPSGGQNKSLYAFLQRRGSMAKYP